MLVLQVARWPAHLCPPGTPKQKNGYDCGVFAIMACNYIGAGKVFDYGQAEVTSFFRPMVAVECYRKRLRDLA